MRVLGEWDEDYLDQQFVQGKLRESQSLEYKASAALGIRDGGALLDGC